MYNNAWSLLVKSVLIQTKRNKQFSFYNVSNVAQFFTFKQKKISKSLTSILDCIDLKIYFFQTKYYFFIFITKYMCSYNIKLYFCAGVCG